MKKSLVLGWVLGIAGTASVACPSGMEAMVTCQIAGRSDVLQVCFNAREARYSFGPQGAPELVLTQSVSQVQIDPWPGAGRFRVQAMTFYNGGYAYSVSTVQDRFSEGINGIEGGVTVSQGGKTLANLECGRMLDYGFLEQTFPYRFN